MSNRDFSVGQVIFLLIKKQQNVVPAKVVERVTRSTLEGESISYVVMMPDSKSTTMDLDSLESLVFKTLEAAQSHMIDNARSAIQKIINTSRVVAQEKFQFTEEVAPDPEPYSNGIDTDHSSPSDMVGIISSEIEVDLGNGSKARFRG